MHSFSQHHTRIEQTEKKGNTQTHNNQKKMSSVALFAAAAVLALLCPRPASRQVDRPFATHQLPLEHDPSGVGFLQPDTIVLSRTVENLQQERRRFRPLVQFFATCHSVSAEAIVQTMTHREATAALQLAVAAVLSKAHPTQIESVSKQLVEALRRQRTAAGAVSLDDLTMTVVNLKTAFATAVHSGAVQSLALLAAVMDGLVIVYGDLIVTSQDGVEAVNCVTALSRELSQWALEAASWRLGVAAARVVRPPAGRSVIRRPTAFAVRTSRAVEVTTEQVPLKRKAQPVK